MPAWYNDYEWLFTLLGTISVVTFVGSLILVPLVIAQMPSDYFVSTKASSTSLSPTRMLLHLLKNLFGYLFLILGFLMLFLPGQGVLTLVLGVSLIDFPGKRKFQLKLLKPRKVRQSIAWIRHKSGKAPFHLPFDDGSKCL